MTDEVRQQLVVLASAVRQLAAIVSTQVSNPEDADLASRAYMAADDIVEGRFGA